MIMFDLLSSNDSPQNIQFKFNVTQVLTSKYPIAKLTNLKVRVSSAFVGGE